MAAHLSGGRVNIAQWRESARRDLLGCLDKCVGSKVGKFSNFFWQSYFVFTHSERT